MFIPPNQLAKQLTKDQHSDSKVRLQSSHLLIDKEVALPVFGEDLNVNMVYYKDRRTLMLAPKSDELFSQLHKAKQHMLKGRNAAGNKSVALHELLIDNEIDDTDRGLVYEYQPELRILNVKL